nr:MAG TPA: hypothetical protein [Caudoviricetes sp.]
MAVTTCAYWFIIHIASNTRIYTCPLGVYHINPLRRGCIS